MTARADFETLAASPPDAESWFEDAFDEEYLTVYRHRDEKEARAVVGLIRSQVPCPEGSPALDLGCGVGRHLRFLRHHHWTVGLDLSASLLQFARVDIPDTSLVRADMRALPFRSGMFQLVVNLFTSFGYFSDDAQNRRVLAEIARVTAPSGWLVLDFLNAVYVRKTLIPFDRRQVGSVVVEQKREISGDGCYVQKATTVVGTDRILRERVRLYELKELLAMLQGCDFKIRRTMGDYYGGPSTVNSPRAIVIGQRS
jgi:SAM-dependent methyltransferase